jgi:hypothetical protein
MTDICRSFGGHCWNEVIRHMGQETATITRTGDTNKIDETFSQNYETFTSSLKALEKCSYLIHQP